MQLVDRSYLSSYVNHVFIGCVYQFEHYAQETQLVTFPYDRVPPQVYGGDQSKLCHFSGARHIPEHQNSRLLIKVKILRCLHLEQMSLVLGVEELPLLNDANLIHLAVVFPTWAPPEIFNKWKQEARTKNLLTVLEPYRRSIGKEVYIITRFQNCLINKCKKNGNEIDSPQQLKEKANEFFKAKSYIQALYVYQSALACITDSSLRKQRAILYCNSSACLFELHLYQSSLIYSQLAILVDPSYAKGYFRRVSILMELGEYTKIPKDLVKLKSMIASTQLEEINAKFTSFWMNSEGIFNWREIIKGRPFGKFRSAKIQQRLVKGNRTFVAIKNIDKHQLILITKPIIYISENAGQLKESFLEFLKLIEKYCLLEEQFENQVQMLPCGCHLTSESRKLEPKMYKFLRSIKKKELFTKLQRSVFQQREMQGNNVSYQMSNGYNVEVLSSGNSSGNSSNLNGGHRNEDSNKKTITNTRIQSGADPIKNGGRKGYGIWPQMFQFQHKCLPNCSVIHLKTAMVVSSVTNIKVGETLSIDFISDIEPLKRQETLNMKFELECKCPLCECEYWPENYEGDLSGLYSIIENLSSIKAKKQMIWYIIDTGQNKHIKDPSTTPFQHGTTSAAYTTMHTTPVNNNSDQLCSIDLFRHNLIYRYLFYLQKQHDWTDWQNLLRLMRQQTEEEPLREIRKAMAKFLKDYLRISQQELTEVISEL